MTIAASGALVSGVPAEAAQTKAPVATPDTFGVHQGTTVRVPCPGVLRNELRLRLTTKAAQDRHSRVTTAINRVDWPDISTTKRIGW
jgi:hypothetical protein